MSSAGFSESKPVPVARQTKPGAASASALIRSSASRKSVDSGASIVALRRATLN
jgi:hypothetical protein